MRASPNNRTLWQQPSPGARWGKHQPPLLPTNFALQCRTGCRAGDICMPRPRSLQLRKAVQATPGPVARRTSWKVSRKEEKKLGMQ